MNRLKEIERDRELVRLFREGAIRAKAKHIVAARGLCVRVGTGHYEMEPAAAVLAQATASAQGSDAQRVLDICRLIVHRADQATKPVIELGLWKDLLRVANQ